MTLKPLLVAVIAATLTAPAAQAGERMSDFYFELLNPSHTATFGPVEEVVYDEIRFAGAWRLVEVMDRGGDKVDLLPEVTFSIAPSGRFRAYAGCNIIFGTLHADDGALVSPKFSFTTQMGCFGRIRDQEWALTHALRAAAMFAHAGEMLVLLDAEGDKLAEFEAM